MIGINNKSIEAAISVLFPDRETVVGNGKDWQWVDSAILLSGPG